MHIGIHCYRFEVTKDQLLVLALYCAAYTRSQKFLKVNLLDASEQDLLFYVSGQIELLPRDRLNAIRYYLVQHQPKPLLKSSWIKRLWPKIFDLWPKQRKK